MTDRMGGGGGGSINGFKGVSERFPDKAEMYRSYLKALRAVVVVAEKYYLAHPDTLEELVAKDTLDQMFQRMKERPGKENEMMEGLVALIVHMKIGGTFDEWFEGVGQ